MFLFGELIKSPFIHLLANYSSSNHLTLHPSIPLVSYFYAIHLFGELTFHPSIPLASYLVIFVSFIPWASYFRADHLILHPLASYFSVYHVTLHPSIPLASYFCAIHSLGKLFSCRPFNSPSFGEFFCADHITSIVLESYFCAFHPLGELFSCRPFNCPIRLSLWRVIFVSSIPWASYFRADHLILHPLASYFNVYHITLHLSIPLASYFGAIHPLGKLFSCRPFNSPAIHPFGELFLCRPFLGRAIFVPTILFSILWRVISALSSPWESYFRADHLTLHLSIPLASYFCTVQPVGELFSCLLFDSPSFGELFSC